MKNLKQNMLLIYDHLINANDENAAVSFCFARLLEKFCKVCIRLFAALVRFSLNSNNLGFVKILFFTPLTQ